MGSIRIVGGALSGRRLRAPAGESTRPTSERVREAIASVLSSRHAIQGARVLELYAGSGALGFEMISRGADHVLFVEKDPRVAKLIRENADELAVEAQVEVLCMDATRPKSQAAIVQRGPFSLVLADPPYRDTEQATGAIARLCAHGMLASDACLLLEHGARAVPVLPSDFRLISDYRYGDTGVILFEREVLHPAAQAAVEAAHEGKER
ncbi:MAG: rRNA ((966)-N(2))-methyltransferase [Myxococcaceae bacterium]|nr:rRNA ((966)-N(2))-methyltransferase [Myxococcaceae bacterium]